MKAAIVLPYWKMPSWERLQDFLHWNEPVLAGVQLVVVLDKHTEIREWDKDKAAFLRHPQEGSRFSLARTCNYGIRWAADNGFDPIVKTDADVMFPADALAELLAVQDKQIISSVYQMVDSVSLRHTWTPNRLVAALAQGTVAMRAAEWHRVCGYHEGMDGYGADDGDLVHRAGQAGIRVIRGFPVWHIAHQAGAVQQEAHTEGDKSKGTRSDHWGRANGVNPLHLEENARMAHRFPWGGRPNWGLAS